MPEVEIGDFVILPVPDVDRGPSDPPNLACRIVDICYETKMHELACQAGVLKDMYARNAFDKLDGSLEGIRVDVKTANQIGGCQLNSLYIFLAVFYNMIKVLFLATESTCNILIFIIKFTWLKAILSLKSRYQQFFFYDTILRCFTFHVSRVSKTSQFNLEIFIVLILRIISI